MDLEDEEVPVRLIDVQVEASGGDGAQTELQVSPSCLISDLKTMVCTRLDRPVCGAQLLTGRHALPDSLAVADVVAHVGHNRLSLTLTGFWVPRGFGAKSDKLDGTDGTEKPAAGQSSEPVWTSEPIWEERSVGSRSRQSSKEKPSLPAGKEDGSMNGDPSAVDLEVCKAHVSPASQSCLSCTDQRLVLLSRMGTLCISIGFFALIIHMVLGVASIGGSMGDDGSSGALGAIFIVCLILGCGMLCSSEFRRRVSTNVVRGPSRQISPAVP